MRGAVGISRPLWRGALIAGAILLGVSIAFFRADAQDACTPDYSTWSPTPTIAWDPGEPDVFAYEIRVADFGEEIVRLECQDQDRDPETPGFEVTLCPGADYDVPLQRYFERAAWTSSRVNVRAIDEAGQAGPWMAEADELVVCWPDVCDPIACPPCCTEPTP